MPMGLGLGLGLGNQQRPRKQSEHMIKYLFVDGNALRMHLSWFSQRYAEGRELALRWQNLLGGYEKVFYYDAIPVKSEEETDEEYENRIKSIAALHDKLSEINGFRVYEGDARKRRGRGLEQKKVDVMIAVDMLTHTIRRNMDRTGLLAGDLDFKPLLDALVNEGMYVTLVYPPRATSSELRAAADSREPLTPTKTFSWLEPDSQETVGVMPSISRRGGLDNQNCQLVLELPDVAPDLKVWKELPTDTVRVTWLETPPSTYLDIRGGNWTRSRLIAEDEFRIKLPDNLPNDFANL